MIKGSCMCGKIRYTIIGIIGEIIHCHCTTCRKAHGSAFSSVAAVQRSNFDVATGKKLLKGYKSSNNKTRYFCSVCGSHIYAYKKNQKHYILRLGTLDDDPKSRPTSHIWVNLKAPWYNIYNDHLLPQYAEWPS